MALRSAGSTLRRRRDRAGLDPVRQKQLLPARRKRGAPRVRFLTLALSRAHLRKTRALRALPLAAGSASGRRTTRQPAGAGSRSSARSQDSTAPLGAAGYNPPARSTPATLSALRNQRTQRTRLPASRDLEQSLVCTHAQAPSSPRPRSPEDARQRENGAERSATPRARPLLKGVRSACAYPPSGLSPQAAQPTGQSRSLH